jgi:membrane protein
VGPAGAETVRLVLENAGSLGQDAISIAVGIAMLLVGATTVLAQLQTSLNHIWNVRVTSSQRVVWSLVRARLVSMAILLAVGFLLLVSLVLSATLAALHHYLSQLLPGGVLLWDALNLVASLLVITLLIATIFKVLPDARIEWHDIWVGALSTSALFGIGKFLIGLYLGRASIGSAYGAAGSLVVFLLWVYYSSLILFLGAEITQVYARRRGARIRPAEYAVLVDAP